MIRLPWRRDAVARPRHGSAADTSSGEMPEGSSLASRAAASGSVRGERGASMTRARSLQARMSSLLAAGLMTSVGAGMLVWYYVEALSRPAAAQRRAQMPAPEAPGEGMSLPRFGPVSPPAAARPATEVFRAPPMPTPAFPVVQSAAAQSGVTLPASPLFEPPLTRAPGELPPSYGAPAQFSARRPSLDRRLSGEVFARVSRGSSPDLASGDEGSGPASGAAAVIRGADLPQDAGVTAASGGALERLLRSSAFAATRAQMLPTQHLLLAKGSFIDCTLETAIDSTLPGMTTCITATDTFSADGTVVLLGRGTKLIGETRGEVRQGQARVFVVWTEARTPAGVVVRLDSPGTDALGRSGLEGEVNRHFWERFGAAVLVSTIDGAVQSEAQSSSRGGTVVLDPTASEDVLTEVLRGTVNIPPTVRVRNGARIQVLVARDIDFRPVYDLNAR